MNATSRKQDDAFLAQFLAAGQPTRFDIVDNRTGLVVGTAKTRARAAQSADKRDNAHGAIRFSVKPIYA